MIDHNNLDKYLKFLDDEKPTSSEPKVGIINILWVGGNEDYESLVGGTGKVQIKAVPGQGAKILTGSLMDVFKESVEVASGYLYANSDKYGFSKDFFSKSDLHLHVPEAATKKDGPSAGAAITTCLLSVIKNIPVRQEVAITGEIDLEGNVLPVGGIQSKVTGAYQNGIKEFLLPSKNKKDYDEIEDVFMKDDIKMTFVENIDEIFKYLFNI